MDRKKEGGESVESVSFEEVFTPDVIDSIVHRIKELGNNQSGSNTDLFQRDFPTHLFKLGVKLQNDDIINQAKAFFPNISLIDQITVYSMNQGTFL